jgi:hypothetical protein
MSAPRFARRLACALGVVLIVATACGSGDDDAVETSTSVAQAATTILEGQTPPPAGPANPATTAPAPPDGQSAAPSGNGGGAPAGGTTAPASPPSLVGLWSGEYKSTVPANADGSFTVVFQGAPPDYTGSIVIAGLCEPDCPVTATVNGNAITFGSVGPRAVSYKGTISGNTISGTYTIGNEGQGSGTWKAVKA